MKLQESPVDWPPHAPQLQRRWQVVGVCRRCGEPMVSVWHWTMPPRQVKAYGVDGTVTWHPPVYELKTWSYCRVPGDSRRRWRWRIHIQAIDGKEVRGLRLKCLRCGRRPEYKADDVHELARRHAEASPPLHRMAV